MSVQRYNSPSFNDVTSAVASQAAASNGMRALAVAAGTTFIQKSTWKVNRDCSLGKSYSVPVLPWRRCFLISVLMKLAENMLWCTTRWQFVTWDAAVNSLGALMALTSTEYSDSRDGQFKRGWKWTTGSLLCVVKMCDFQLVHVSGSNKNWCAER